MTLLSIEDLSLSLLSGREILRGVGLEVAAGETVGLVGESGSGKSTTARVALRLLPDGAQVSGRVTVCGHELVDASPVTVREVRRGDDLPGATFGAEPRAPHRRLRVWSSPRRCPSSRGCCSRTRPPRRWT